MEEEMTAVLVRAACFVGVIALGYILRRTGFFKEGDFNVLSRVVLKITLPAAIVTSFNGRDIQPSMLFISLLGLGFGILYMALGFALNVRAGKEKMSFEILNLSGYNIGNFTMPFAISFLGTSGGVIASLFDTGNAVVCLGGAYSVAAMVQDGGRFSPRKIAKNLLRSVPFDTYVVMILLCLFHLRLPQAVVSFAEIAGNANAFLAMLMIGVGFRLTGDKSQLGAILRILLVRYGIAAILAIGCYCLLPPSYRQAMVVLTLSPIASACPAFTADLKNDVGLSSAVNSISIVISIILIVSVLLVM